MAETSETMSSPSGSEILVGGQALLEGVMMRTPAGYGVAVRRPDGSIALERAAVPSLLRRMPVLRLPLLRGVAILGQSLALGFRALNFSASVLMDEGESAEKAAPSTSHASSGWLSALSTALAVAAGLLVFLFLPLWLTQTLERWWLGPLSSLTFNLIDGAWRGVFFLAYLLGISRLPDIHRVFMYHGAEHKVVFSQEFGEELTVENARRQSRLHPRCGTSFLLFVLLVSILVFSLIPRDLPLLAKFASRIALLPVLLGVSYEVLRLTAKRRRNPLFRLMVWPGLMLQKITTQEPTDDMLEVAIAALQEAWRAEHADLAVVRTPALAARG
ncbi:MAG: DUF1385 domain-containing protein [Acidobacteriota bacterium]